MTVDEVRLAGTRPDGRVAVLERPGARLVYEVAGEGPAVVLIHGFGLDMRMWDPQAGPLAARFRVLRYDCRGFGASGPFDPPSRTPTPAPVGHYSRPDVFRLCVDTSPRSAVTETPRFA